ncbi:MAG: OmpA family protein [Planctomycetota bacterium]
MPSVMLAAIAASSMLVGCNNAQKDELAMLREENSQLELQRDEARSALDASEAERRRLEEQLGNTQTRANEQPPAATTTTTSTGFENLPAGVTAETRNGEVVLTIEGDVLFDSGKATLKTDAKRTLDKVVSEIKKQYPNSRIRLAGFTDTDPIKKSPFKTNYHLGFERAFNVGEYIATKGIDQTRIHYSSFGPDAPKSTKKASRRVELAIVNE